MKKVLLSAVAAYALTASAALAADLPVKAKPVAAPPPPAWDIAFGAGIASDYAFRGISQSNQKPSGSAYFEPRYNVNPDLQLYVGTAALKHQPAEPRSRGSRLLRRYSSDLRQARPRLRRSLLLVSGRHL